MKYKDWTITDTSQHFGVSIGLVSENIRIAKDIDNGRNSEKIMAAKTREDGLKLMERRRYYRSKNDNILIKINDEDEE
jgi:hypothetical protein